MRGLICRVLGHRDVPARSLGLAVIPTMGLTHSWKQCDAADSRGMGCTRCYRYDEHSWLTDARELGLDP